MICNFEDNFNNTLEVLFSNYKTGFNASVNFNLWTRCNAKFKLYFVKAVLHFLR